MKSRKCIVPVSLASFFEDKPKMISFVFIVQKISRIFYIVSQTTADAKKQITY